MNQMCFFFLPPWAAIVSTASASIVWTAEEDESVWAVSPSVSVSVSVADCRVHVLRHHAEQMGPADVPAGLHEEPPGLPPRPPRASLALLQLHVHARRVRR